MSPARTLHGDSPVQPITVPAARHTAPNMQVVSAQFEGMRLVQRHQLVYSLLTEQFKVQQPRPDPAVPSPDPSTPSHLPGADLRRCRVPCISRPQRAMPSSTAH